MGFEWKVYDFDNPKTLKQRLIDHGFEAEDKEALMVYDVNNSKPEKLNEIDGFEVNEISSIKDMEKLVKFQETVWDKSFPWLLDHMKKSIGDSVYFMACHNGDPVGTGWIDYHKDSAFAEIHGGAVHPAYRGRGIYSTLFSKRLEHARNKGHHYLAVDAGPMSFPILKAKGFRKLCSSFPLKMQKPNRPHF